MQLFFWHSRSQLGFLSGGLALSWLNISFNNLSTNLNRSILQVKTTAQLSFELVNYTTTARSAIVRNVASVPVTVTRVGLVTPEGYLRAHYPPTIFANLTKILPGENATLTDDEIPACYICVAGERLKMRIWYVASALFDEANPVHSADEMKYVETVFLFPGGRLPTVCEIPEGVKWMAVDLIDPITFTDSGRVPRVPSNKLFIVLRSSLIQKT